MNSFKQFEEKINKQALQKIAVAAAEDKEVLLAVKDAVEKNIATFHLIGNASKIKEYAAEINLPFNDLMITDEVNPVTASRLAVESVSSGESQVLMKGLIPTATILKAVLDKEIGLRAGNILSHVALFELDNYNKMLYLTDAAMNIAPNLEQKVQIVQNAINFSHSIESNEPHVAMLAAVETVNPAMQATIDAAIIAKMSERGQITGAVVDGPLAFDNAISPKAAQHKGIESKVAGNTDILVVPNIEVGNALYKSLVYLTNAKVGAVITGAKAPIVLTSRADSHQTKLNSILLAVLSAQK